MADSITTQVISDTAGVKYVVKRTNHSDGTGETDSVLVDPTTSNFMTADGTKTMVKYGTLLIQQTLNRQLS